MKDLAVVILNYNGQHFLEKFLGNAIRNSPEAEVIIIDNASTDGSIDFLSQQYPDLRVIRLEENFGFAEGYNRGLAQISHSFFVLLNSDVEVTENWLPPLIEVLQNNPKTAAVQPKILDYKKKDHFEYAGAAGGYMDLWGFPFCRGRVFDYVEKDEGQYNDPKEIFWATGAAFCVRASVFKELNGLDAKFFAHMEEIDLCWRMHNAGYTVEYEPRSKVYHVGGGTLAVLNPYKTYLNYRNSLFMLFKNLPAHLMFPILFTRLSMDGIAGVRYIFRGEFSNLWAVLKSHYAFYMNFPYLIRHRENSFKGFKKLYSGSVVWNYFIKRKNTYRDIC